MEIVPFGKSGRYSIEYLGIHLEEIFLSPEIVNGLFAISGALIGVFGTWFVTKSTKEIKKITLFRSPSSNLLVVGDLAKSDVEILYRGDPINELYQGQVAIQNTGTQALEKLELVLEASEGSPLLDVEITNANYPWKHSTEMEGGPDDYLILIDYLNPNDRLVIDYRSPGAIQPEVTCRKIGVDVTLKEESVSWIPDIYANFLFEVFDVAPAPFRWYLKHSLRGYRLYLESRKDDDS